MPTFVTTSLPYVNGAPHIGHALEFVQADAFVRFRRLTGEDTRFLSGTDDNSLKNVLAAEREGLPVPALIERNSATFQRLLQALDVSNDDFIRTSIDQRHIDGARRVWTACDRAGDLYRRHYRGLYCVGCEQFYAPDDLQQGVCPEHLCPLEALEEDNYFFRLSRYTDQLIDLIDSGRLRIVPAARRNEVRSFLSGGLQDISVSRTRTRARGWGIPVPGDDEQVLYVWFDALTNYVTALDYATDGPLFDRYWCAAQERLHVIGKGITRFHAVYWPALLLSAGLPLPTTIFVHGYLTIGGEKIGKSRGNVVDPLALIERIGSDALRYWLLRAVPPTGDADYTDDKLEQVYSADLAKDLGNLVQRTLSLLGRYCEQRIPAPGGGPDLAPGLRNTLGQTVGRDLDPRAALSAIWDIVSRANRYAEATAPWRETDPVRRAAALFTLAESVRVIGEALRPFLPRTSGRIFMQLGIAPEQDWLAALSWGRLVPGTLVDAPRQLFPRLTEQIGNVALAQKASLPGVDFGHDVGE
jgi:methionyl-tRNA synthetase